MIAIQSGRKFEYKESLSTVTYNNGVKDTVTVILVCATTDTVKASQTSADTYLIFIENECACPGKCVYKPESSNSLGFGAIFVILILSGSAAYLLFGAIFLRFVRHENGVNMIPNRTFWLQASAYFLQGFRFSLSKICPRQISYEKV